MCTVSWIQTATSLYLVFNRDERRHRSPAKPPDIVIQNGVKCLYPIDPDGGGTWLGANEFGLVAGILNFYEADEDYSEQSLSPEMKSRGTLLTDILTCRKFNDLQQQLRQHELAVYRPFHLLAFYQGRASRFTWNGTHLSEQGLTMDDNPITTSSVLPDQVIDYRKKRFPSSPPTPESLRTYHDQQQEDNPSFSVRMNRENARTVSITELNIQNEILTLSYDDFEHPLHTTQLKLEPSAS